jgi:hypothetical protein
MSARRTLCALSLALAAFALSSTALASGGGSLTPDAGWYPLFGPSLGLSVQSPGVSGLLGAELSVPYLTEELAWIGPWADAVWDPRAGGSVLGLGAEAGYVVFGVDAGYVIEVADENRHGVRGRLICTLALAGVYLGYTGWISGGGPTHVVSLGLLLKLPLVKNF